MPLDVRLTEGTQPIPSPLDKCPQEKGLDPTVQQKQQIILNHSTRFHDEHEDVKPKDLEIKTELVDSLLMHKIENEADDDEEDFEEAQTSDQNIHGKVTDKNRKMEILSCRNLKSRKKAMQEIIK